MATRWYGSVPCLCLAAILVMPGCTTKSTPSSGLAQVSGEYLGTAQDSVAGAQTVATTLAQHGSAVGGTLTLTTAGVPNTEAIAWTLTTAKGLSGTGTETVGAATCTFAMTGTYNSSTNQITGTYTAVAGCAGTTGSYTLTQQCTDPATSDKRRPLGFIAAC